MYYIQFLILGALAGILGGILGIGGGTVIIPYLVYISCFSQHQAQGVSLTLSALPVGILAALKYYKEGNLNIKIGILVALGFFVGGYLGALIAHKIPDTILKKIFGIYLFLISVKMIFG
ncbi:MAG: sulfite exporter TauE/SafE family protein [candidate division WOR-3 bacterium]